MKIYNRHAFLGGILCLVLAAVCGGLLTLRGFQTKLLVSLVLLVLLGGADIGWSLSRESRPSRGDERDRRISEKSAWRAFMILTNGCFAASLVLLGAYAFTKGPALLTAAITLMTVVAAAFAVLLGVNLYYEKRL